MRCSSPSSSEAVSGPTHSSARANRSARRRSQVPAGGTRTRSTQCENPHRFAPGKPVALMNSSTSARVLVVPAKNACARFAIGSMSTSAGILFTRRHHSWPARRIPVAKSA